MSRRQSYAIISVLAVVAVTFALLLAYLLGSGAGDDLDTAADTTTSSSTPASATSTTLDETSEASEASETSETTVVRSPAPSTVTVPPAPAPAAQAQPTFVECLFGTPGPARFSDGSIRNHQPCAETPEAQRSRDAESNCNSAEWRRQMAAEGDRFCGSSAWADGFFG